MLTNLLIFAITKIHEVRIRIQTKTTTKLFYNSTPTTQKTIV
mgnify:CR=1 FL=1